MVVNSSRLTRRSVLAALATAAGTTWCGFSRAAAAGMAFTYPMQLPGRAPGDGFYVRVAYAAENARYYPGWWHTGENWHRLGDETAGLPVSAIADGEVVFAGYDYPGLVVIVRHAPDLYSIYGHLAYDAPVAAGMLVSGGDLLGTVLAREDDLARSHLHFEVRTFFIRDEINGSAPQYGVACGIECPPGPGYWPMDAPDHPSTLDWRNPTHAINQRAWPSDAPSEMEVIVPEGAPTEARFWSAPSSTPGAEDRGTLPLQQGQVLQLQDVFAGDEAALETGAEATQLWYFVTAVDGEQGWVQALVPTADELGENGRPSSWRFVLVPRVGDRRDGGRKTEDGRGLRLMTFHPSPVTRKRKSSTI